MYYLCRLPGASIDKPNTYPFGTPYVDIYNQLALQDIDLYTHNGLLKMLERNKKIKLAPQKFQDFDAVNMFELIITCTYQFLLESIKCTTNSKFIFF